MSKIGIDLGTTYTTVCYVNESKQPLEDGYIEVFKAEDSKSVPSAIAYHKTESDRFIGSAARALLQDQDYLVYQHFKMLLALEGTPDLASFIEREPDYACYGLRNPSQVAQDFFTDLLAAFMERQNVSSLDKVVVTMPLVWRGFQQQMVGNTGSARHKLVGAIKAAYQAACKALKHECKAVRIEVKSEPEAAAGFFAHEYLRMHKKTFDGTMLVVDYGGGTLDLTLAKVTSNAKGTIELSTLEKSGKGKPLEFGLGVAGVAYDRALLDLLLQKNDKTLSAVDYAASLDMLEAAKRQLTVRKNLNNWVVTGAEPSQVFMVSGMRVKCADCQNAFDATNAPALKDALEEVFKPYPGLDKSNELMVVLAGGFSNLALVEHQVRKHIGACEDVFDKSDHRLALNSMDQRQFAIAMGAALVSAQLLDIDDSKTDFQIGLWVRGISGDWRYFQIVDRGTPFKQLNQPSWARSVSGELVPFAGGGYKPDPKEVSGVFLGYSETGDTTRTPRPIPLLSSMPGQAATINKFIPGWKDIETRWTIGFSVQADEVDVSGEAAVLVHFQNLQTQASKSYPISQLSQVAQGVVAIEPTVEEEFGRAYRTFQQERKASSEAGNKTDR